MFTKKSHQDLKKSTVKIQDSKRDSATRLKHLKILLDHYDIDESKLYFESNYSHVYFILYDNFIQAENNLRQKVHKAGKEELEAALHLLEKVLSLLPELLSKRWQMHSLTRIFSKLLHPANSARLRAESVRYFLMWYQALGDNAPGEVHRMFATLVPGVPILEIKPTGSPIAPKPMDLTKSIPLQTPEYTESNIMQHPNFTSLYDNQGMQHKKTVLVEQPGLIGRISASIFHDTNLLNPVQSVDILPLLPPTSNEKPMEHESKYFLEILLDAMATSVTRVYWRDRSHAKAMRSFAFLLDKFKAFYVPVFCPQYDRNNSLYSPNLDLPVEHNVLDDEWVLCRVALIKWITNHVHTPKKHLMEGGKEAMGGVDETSFIINSSRDSSSSNITSPLQQQSFENGEMRLNLEEIFPAIVARDVLVYLTRDNINFTIEIMRQAFLLPLSQAATIRRVITAYKDWIQLNFCELPPFLLEPSTSSNNSSSTSDSSSEQSNRRLRSHSYIDAVHKDDHLYLRAGLQRVVQVFITQAANVFVCSNASSMISGAPQQRVLLDEQTDTCKRILNLYRYTVMHVARDDNTWEQLLLVLLQITSLVLTKVSPKRKHETLGGCLAPAIFQTLIVTWIKANLNVSVRSQLWQNFMDVLSRLTHWEELLKEWAKTMETLTRVLARHVYGVDLAALSDNRTRFKQIQPQPQPPQSQDGAVSKGDGIDGSKASHRTPRISLRRCKSDTHLPHKLEEMIVSKSSKTESKGAKMHDVSLSSLDATSLKSSLKLRRHKSLDSLRHVRIEQEKESQYCGSRSPSPAPSSGIESNSMKDSPMQIDLVNDASHSEIEGGAVSASLSHNTSQLSNNAASGGSLYGIGVSCGGTARGWVWDAAGVLWRRMLAALGSPNKLPPQAHNHHAQLLLHTYQTLLKIAANQTLDGNIETHVPFNLFAGWCLEAEGLPPAYKAGKLKALQLLCSSTHSIVVHPSPNCTALHPQHLQLYQRALHHGLTSEERSVVDVIIKYAAPRYLSLSLDGYSLLLLDFVHASTVVLNSSDFTKNCPRTEAVIFLGSLLNLPDRLMQAPMLQPYPHKYNTVSCPDLKEHVVNIVVRVCRRESNCRARIAGAHALISHIHRTLVHSTKQNFDPRLPSHVLCLLHMLTMKNKQVAKIVSDGLFVLADSTEKIMDLYPGLAGKIVRWLCGVLVRECDKEEAKPLLGSLLLSLAEFSINIGPEKLMEKTENSDNTLLLTIFKVLYVVMRGKRNFGECEKLVALQLDEDFDPEIQMDDLAQTTTTNIDVKLWAQMICSRLVVSLGHWPLSRGHELSSTASELEISNDFINSNNMLFLRLHHSLYSTFIDMPTTQPQPGVYMSYEGGGCVNTVVRVILRELCGKSCWDFSPAATPLAPAIAPPIPQPLHVRNEVVCVSSLPVPKSSGQFPYHDKTQPDHHQLDRLMDYIKESSPEVGCAWNDLTSSNNDYHDNELIAALAQHKNQMRAYLQQQNYFIYKEERCENASIETADCAHTVESKSSVNIGGRALLRQLGALSWQRRKHVQLLTNDKRLQRELHNLDSQRCRETHKVAIIYVGRGQERREEILSNRCGSPQYEAFLAALAWEVELERHSGFSGGLGKGGGGGASAPYYSSSTLELLFHVATRMPATTPDHILTKTRHLGNDEVHVIWSEHYREYKREILPTQFCDVLIVLYPIPGNLLRLTINRKADVSMFGPLSSESIISLSSAASLIRACAVCGGRAVRAALPLYQHAYSERAKALDAPHLLYRTTHENFLKRLIGGSADETRKESNNRREMLPPPPSNPSAITDQQQDVSKSISPKAIKRIGAFKRTSGSSGDGPSSPPMLPARRNR